MPTPTNRTPLRVARGTYSNLNGSLSDIQEGEICYATDQDKLYVKEGAALVSTQGSFATLSDAQTFTAPQRGNVSSIASSGGSITFDFTLSNNFLWNLSENTTAVNITANSLVAGQSGSIFIAQPSSGGPYTVGGWNAAFLFSGAAAPTITATASKTDRIDYVVKSATEIQVVWTGNY